MKLVQLSRGIYFMIPFRRLRMSTMSHMTHMPTFDTCYSGLQVLSKDPPVYIIHNFLDLSTCKELISTAIQEGEEVEVSKTYLLHKEASNNHNPTESSSKVRNSTTFYLKPEQLSETCQKVSQLTGSRISTFEEPQIIRYVHGQQFTWHQDAVPRNKLNPHAGNRLATVLIYLNTLPECTEAKSGYTSFKTSDIHVRPEAGKCLIFFPCFRDGMPDARSVHCSNMITENGIVKWALQIWVHERPYL